MEKVVPVAGQFNTHPLWARELSTHFIINRCKLFTQEITKLAKGAGSVALKALRALYTLILL